MKAKIDRDNLSPNVPATFEKLVNETGYDAEVLALEIEKMVQKEITGRRSRHLVILNFDEAQKVFKSMIVRRIPDIEQFKFFNLRLLIDSYINIVARIAADRYIGIVKVEEAKNIKVAGQWRRGTHGYPHAPQKGGG